jgi:hypothetical protein
MTKLNVIPIRRRACKETVDALAYMLDLAERGELLGIALCSKTTTGEELIAFTGKYRSDPSKGLAAAMRMSIRLNALLDEREP